MKKGTVEFYAVEKPIFIVWNNKDRPIEKKELLNSMLLKSHFLLFATIKTDPLKKRNC